MIKMSKSVNSVTQYTFLIFGYLINHMNLSGPTNSIQTCKQDLSFSNDPNI